MEYLFIVVVGMIAVPWMRSYIIGSGCPTVLGDALAWVGTAVFVAMGIAAWSTALAQDMKTFALGRFLFDITVGIALLLVAILVSCSLRLGRSPGWLVLVGLPVALGSLRIHRKQASGSTGHGPTSHAREMTADGLRAMTPTGFEHYVADLLTRLGWTDVRHTGGRGGMGADVLAVDPDGQRVLVQCKRYAAANPVRSGDIQTVVGVAHMTHKCDRVLVVTTGRYTDDAHRLAFASGPELTLWDANVILGRARSLAATPSASQLECSRGHVRCCTRSPIWRWRPSLAGPTCT